MYTGCVICKTERIELFIYRVLGVLVFRKLTLYLERFIHRKDGEKNVNYHPKSYSLLELQDFLKFYYYNGKIHVRNSIGLFCVIVLQLFLGVHRVFTFFSILFLIKDIYCVMLQRYNYIRTKQLIKLLETREQKKAQIYAKMYLDAKNHIPNIDIETIRELKKFLLGTDDFVVCEDNVYMLKEFRGFQSIINEMQGQGVKKNGK